METFQKRFLEAKDQSGLRWIDIAKRSGLDKASISQYKNGVHVPEPDALFKLAVALNVSMEWLTGADVSLEQRKVARVPTDVMEILNRYQQLNDLGKSKFMRLLDNLLADENYKR